MKKHTQTLPLTTPLKVVAYHKHSDKTIEKTMTLQEWTELKKSKEYFYRAFQII